ncbi:thiamine biosynthesis protein ThiS [Acidobacteria bacterium Mor1]|nr:thiamine biosynthesis protein ThiS [Acidobacteria bacterium Mor1]
MTRVVFTQNLERHIPCPPKEVAAQTVRDALDAVFHENPQLRGYVLDEQGRLRRHVVCFVDGQMIEDRNTLSDRLENDSELYVMQALSGG